MKQEQIHELTTLFEGHAQQTEGGIEYWLARDIQVLLGYSEWRNFSAVLAKAKTACDASNHSSADHFVDVNKTIQMPKNAEKSVDDVMLTRFACYLVAQNGDPHKPEIAFAQSYFAIQTRRAELIEQRLLETERVSARKKLTETEKELSQIIFEQTGGSQDFAKIRSKGDLALFGKSTQSMKSHWNVLDNRPLADFAPTIILKAKDFASEITIHNARENQMSTKARISNEHVANNTAVRNVLLERGIRPESLPAAEDVKRVERRLTSEGKRSFEQPEGLENETHG
ncbi:DNA damage-inducible protein D [soil metagenome]